MGPREDGIYPESLSKAVAQQGLELCSQPHSSVPPAPAHLVLPLRTPPICLTLSQCTTILVPSSSGKPRSGAWLQVSLGTRHGQKPWSWMNRELAGFLIMQSRQASAEGSLLGPPGRCPDFHSFKWPLGEERRQQVIKPEGQRHSRKPRSPA